MMTFYPSGLPLNRRTEKSVGHAVARGFTLVELLVVIGIIAVLVSLLLPALNKARFAAQQTQCLSNIRQLTLAINGYAADNKGALPRYRASNAGSGGTIYQVATAPPGLAGQATKWPVDWTMLIMKYTGATPRTTVYSCPIRAWRTVRKSTFVWQDGKTYDVPLVSYRVNGACLAGVDAETSAAFTITAPTGSAYNVPIDRPFGPVFRWSGADLVDTEETLKMGKVAPDTVMISECVRRTAGASGNESFGEASGTYFSTGPSTAITSVSTSSHQNKNASFAFFDGSARIVTAEELSKTLRNKTDLNNRQYSRMKADGLNQGNPGDMLLEGWNSSGNPARGQWSAARD